VYEIIKAARDLQEVCESERWRYCFIGGLALQRWGQPRETVDVDLTLLTGFGTEERYIQKLLQFFRPRIELAAEFARERRILLLTSAQGVGLDIALAGLPYEELIIERASPFMYPPDIELRTCSAEDLIVLKAFANRLQDWADIERIIMRQTDALDWDYTMAQLAPLVELKDAPEILAQLERMRLGNSPDPY
jgi:hypothetical protein